MNTHTRNIRITLTEPMLGMTPANPSVHSKYIASRAPDAATLEDEIAAHGVHATEQEHMTVFPRLPNGQPYLYDYQIKGMCKDACGMLYRVAGTASNKLKAYKKFIDGLLFVNPRRIPIELHGEITNCQRPLRTSGPTGERTALASSEQIPVTSTFAFTVQLLDERLDGPLTEWLDYGKLRGFGQWRNSGMGRYTWEEID